MSGIPALDVAIGLMFLYFVLSIVISRFNEGIATIWNWRAKDLVKGLQGLLGPEDAEKVLASDDVKSVTQEGKPDPSYLSGRAFALALVNVYAGTEDNAMAQIKTKVEELAPSHPAKKTLLRFVNDAGSDLDKFRKDLEGWFDSGMERVSGWYKRRVQKFLLIYAVVLTVILNVDSFVIARSLWQDETIRAAVVAEAEKAVEEDTADEDTGGTIESSEDPIGDTTKAFDEVSEAVSRVKQLSLPIGWTTAEGDPRWPGDGLLPWFPRLAGWAVTIAALTLGAPFWFDLLSKVSRLRNTGPKPNENAEGSAPASR